MDEGRQSLTGLFRFTYRTWRANLAPLLVVGLVATVVSLLAAVLLEGVHSEFFLSGASLGIVVSSGSDGSGVRLEAPMLVTGLITIAAGSWASTTMVTMLLRHLLHGRRSGVGDLGCGLRSWGWVALATLIIDAAERTASLLVFWLSPFFMLAVVVVTLALATVFVFYVQMIVDARHTALTTFGASWTLVRSTGSLRVLGNLVLFGVCLVPVLMAATLLSNVLYSSWAASAVRQLFSGVVEASLFAAFTTVLYLLARGDREPVEAVLGPPWPNGGPRLAGAPGGADVGAGPDMGEWSPR